MKKKRVAELSSPLCISPLSPNVKEWMRLFSEGQFTYSVLKEYIVNQMPEMSDRLLESPTASSADTPEWAAVSEVEQFVYNGERGPVLDYLRGVESVPSYCGRTLKNGEPTYSCRECGHDATCVLCTECFQRSDHRLHKYRMSTSEGGGLCDCGDMEAWKSSPSCTAHSPQPTNQTPAELPVELRQRCTLAFSFVVQFALEVLSKVFDVKAWDEKAAHSSRYLLVVYNDEVHTFEQVIDILVDVIQCPAREGLQLASKIDSEGRAVISVSDFQTCSRQKRHVEVLSARVAANQLEVVILPFSAVAYQQLAHSFLDWLRKTVAQSVGLRSVVSAVLQDNHTSSHSFLDRILLQDPLLWKASRVHWHSLVCSAMLMEYEHKKTLASSFVTNYESIVNNYLKSNESYQFCSASLSVQLFTIPSITLALISERNILQIAIDFVIEAYPPNRDFQVSFKPAPSLEFRRRAAHVLNDVKYLLSSPPTSWTKELREGFLRGMFSFLYLLSLIEGLDAVTRQVDAYTDLDIESRATFNLMLDVFPIITALTRWCESDENILIESYKMVLNRLKLLASQIFYSEAVVSFGGRQALCASANLAVAPVTLQIPMTRFWGGLYLCLDSHQLGFYSDELAVPDSGSPLKLIAPVIRSQAMLAQFQARMWQKNGQSLARQIALYRSRLFVPMMWQKDVTVLQIGASLMEADAFLINIISQFGLSRWTANELSCDTPETDTAQLLTLINELLYLIIVVVAERYQIGVGNVSEDECTKYQMIHLLSGRPMSHSELVNAVTVRSDGDEIIEEIASFKTDENNGNGRYVLRDGYPNNFNVFFYQFSKEESLRAERLQMKNHKSANGLECCPPPVLPAFLEHFSGIVNLLKCDVMLDMMVLVLKMGISSKEDFGLENQLHNLLFLIGMALREEEASNGDFGFIVKAKEWGLNRLLVELHQKCKFKDHTDTMKWVMERYRSSGDILMVNFAPNDFSVEARSAKRIAEEAKNNILAKMRSMQEKFVKSHAESTDVSAMHSVTPESDSQSVMCIICQYHETVSEEGRMLVLPAYVQLSTVLVTRNDNVQGDADLLTTKPTPYVSTCGHPMHADCLEAWKTEWIRKKANEAPTSLLILDGNQNEFLCPLCQCVSNSSLPILATNGVEQGPEASITFAQWVRHVSQKLQHYQDRPGLGIPLATLNAHISPTSTEDCTQSTLMETSLDPATTSHPGTVNQQSTATTLADPNTSFVALPDNGMGKALGDFFKDVCSVANNKTPTTVGWTPTVIWKTVAYTIRSIENCKSFTGQPFLGAMSFREKHCLENLVQLTFKLGEHTRGKEAENQAWELLSNILEAKSARARVLHWDYFGILLMLLAMIRNVANENQPTRILERFVQHLMLLSHIFQILISMDLQQVGETRDPVIMVSDSTISLDFLNKVMRNQGNSLNTDAVWEEIKKQVKPFLRCCAVLHHMRTKRNDSTREEVGDESFETLCSYLQLSATCNEMFGDVTTQSLLISWANSPEMDELYGDARRGELQISSCHSLVPLPEDYSELLNRVQAFTCSNSNRDDAKNPILCLICGEILCSLSYCCQTELNGLNVGACTAHTQHCGAGAGLYLRIRTCQAMMLAGCGRGCFKVPPYLDDHNEPDQGLRRGNRLHLNQKIYRKLQLARMNHSIYEEVSSAMESKYSLIRWHYF